MSRVHAPALVESAKSIPSVAIGGTGIIFIAVDKFTEHLLLGWFVDKVRELVGESGVLVAITAHPFIAYVVLALGWVAFVYYRARNVKPPESQSPKDPASPVKVAPNNTAEASGPQSRALSVGGDISGSVSLGDEHTEVHIHHAAAPISDPIVHIEPEAEAGRSIAYRTSPAISRLQLSALEWSM